MRDVVKFPLLNHSETLFIFYSRVREVVKFPLLYMLHDINRSTCKLDKFKILLSMYFTVFFSLFIFHFPFLYFFSFFVFQSQNMLTVYLVFKEISAVVMLIKVCHFKIHIHLISLWGYFVDRKSLKISFNSIVTCDFFLKKVFTKSLLSFCITKGKQCSRPG